MVDPDFPALHLRPTTGWLNDPNGPFRWAGRYHLFFQHNPAGPAHGAICWGHATSADLVRWEMEPVALQPTPGGPDAGGCWSGCVVDDHGVPTAVYSGLVQAHHETTVCLARAADPDDDRLRGWRKHPVPVMGPPAGTEWIAFRDPFLFTHDGRRFALVGGGTADAGARVELFGCDDLRTWSRRGALLDLTDPVARELADAEIWECPQLVSLDERWVLILSLVKGGALTRVAFLTGDLQEEGRGLRFRPAGGGLVDHGHDFYAPAVLVEEERTLLWGWSWEDRPEHEVVAAGWAGMLTLPRVLALDARGRLTSSLAPEVEALRGDGRVHLGPGTFAAPSGPFELDLVASRPAVLTVGGLTVEADPLRGRVRVDRTVHDPARRSWPTHGAVPAAPVRLRVVVDASIVEVYVEDGPVFTERVYVRGAPTWGVAGEHPVEVAVYELSLGGGGRPAPRRRAEGAATAPPAAPRWRRWRRSPRSG